MNIVLFVSSLLFGGIILHTTRYYQRSGKNNGIVVATYIGAITSCANHGTTLSVFTMSDRAWMIVSFFVYLRHMVLELPITQRQRLLPVLVQCVVVYLASKGMDTEGGAIRNALHAFVHMNVTYLYSRILSETEATARYNMRLLA